jgi:hypothetical protein
MSSFNNVGAVLRGGEQADIADIVRRITIFIVRQCAPIISHRLRSDKFIFQDTTLDKIFQEWEPSDRDNFSETECEISEHLVMPFQKRGIRCRQSNGKYFALWTKEVAPAWMKTFLSYLSACKNYFKIEGEKVAGNAAMGATTLKVLQTLVTSEGFKYLLRLESVIAILDQEVLRRRRGAIS